MCLSHLIYTVQPCLIHTCHAMPMPCSDHAVLLTARPCCGLEKNGMVGAWHGHGMTSVNQTRPYCVNQKGKTHSKPLVARHGRRTAWARHDMCESVFRMPLNYISLTPGTVVYLRICIECSTDITLISVQKNRISLVSCVSLLHIHNGKKLDL